MLTKGDLLKAEVEEAGIGPGISVVNPFRRNVRGFPPKIVAELERQHATEMRDARLEAQSLGGPNFLEELKCRTPGGVITAYAVQCLARIEGPRGPTVKQLYNTR